MEEMIDVFDENTGEKTGEVISKNEAHKKGIWHSSIHLLIVSEDKTKTLLQKRCADKKLYPNTWDIAVGGHISAGETPKISVRRELEEELGLNLNDYNIEYLITHKEKLLNNDVNSNEFVSVFIIYADIDINDITLQKEEVSEVKWATKEELNDLINNQQIIPHVEEYKILNDILYDKILYRQKKH